MPRRPERLIACEVSMFRILVINPGSTSTKIAVYEDEAPLFVESRDHDTAKLSPAVMEQFRCV